MSENKQQNDDYWKGFIDKQKDAMEICKTCINKRKLKDEKYKELIDIIKSFTNDDFKKIEDLFDNFKEYHCRADNIEWNKTLKKIKQLKKLYKTL